MHAKADVKRRKSSKRLSSNVRTDNPLCTPQHPSGVTLPPGKVMVHYCSAGWLKRVVPSTVNPKALATYRNMMKGHTTKHSDLETPFSEFMCPGRVRVQSCSAAWT